MPFILPFTFFLTIIQIFASEIFLEQEFKNLITEKNKNSIILFSLKIKLNNENRNKKELTTIDTLSDAINNADTDEVCHLLSNFLTERSIHSSDVITAKTILSFLKQPKKEWTILIYIAGDNDLYKFALRNIAEMQQLGSNENINILVHFDHHPEKSNKETKRFYVEQGRLIQIGNIAAMDSGKEETLINACLWAIGNFPSEKFCLIFWNHGTGGALTPKNFGRLINPRELFFYDCATKKVLLDRNIQFIDFLEKTNGEKGICFDSTTKNVLDDKKIARALSQVVNFREGKKIDIILMDACLMADIEMVFAIFPFANYFAASQEVVLGPGYNYSRVLDLLHKDSKIDSRQFAIKIVDIFEKTYAPITPDYTESAIDLEKVLLCSKFIEEFSKICLHFMAIDKNNVIKKMLKVCGSQNICTHFEEPSYIDLKHFLENIDIMAKKIAFIDGEGKNFFNEIHPIIENFIKHLEKLILHAVSGKNLPRAHGLSIYFPRNGIHPSFLITTFAQKHPAWIKLLTYLNEK